MVSTEEPQPTTVLGSDLDQLLQQMSSEEQQALTIINEEGEPVTVEHIQHLEQPGNKITQYSVIPQESSAIEIVHQDQIIEENQIHQMLIDGQTGMETQNDMELQQQQQV